MRRTLPLLMAALALCPAALRADPAADARRAIQSAYNSADAAAARKDAAGMTAHDAPDAVSVDMKGHVTTEAQEKQQITALLARVKSVKFTSVIQKFALGGPTRANVTIHKHAILAVANPQTQQTIPVVIDATDRDLWVKTAQGWRAKHSQELSHTMTANGQPVPDQP